MSGPTPQKIRRQRRRLALTAIFMVMLAVAMATVFVCSWLAKVLIG